MPNPEATSGPTDREIAALTTLETVDRLLRHTTTAADAADAIGEARALIANRMATAVKDQHLSDRIAAAARANITRYLVTAAARNGQSYLRVTHRGRPGTLIISTTEAGLPSTPRMRRVRFDGDDTLTPVALAEITVITD